MKVELKGAAKDGKSGEVKLEKGTVVKEEVEWEGQNTKRRNLVHLPGRFLKSEEDVDMIWEH